jgi:hypothetical protein
MLIHEFTIDLALTLSTMGRFKERFVNCSLLFRKTSVKSPYAMYSNIIHGEDTSSKYLKKHKNIILLRLVKK